MKAVRSLLVAVAVSGLVVFLSGVSFAQGEEAKVKALRDSAAALQQSNPDLAKGLTEFANEEAKETKEKSEKSEVKKEAHESHSKLLKDAAVALDATRPDLAKELRMMSKGKKKAKDIITEKNEKEEVGEKTEPKSEQGENKAKSKQ